MSGLANVQAADRIEKAAHAAKGEAARTKSIADTERLEAAVAAMEEVRKARAAEAKRLAAGYFEYLANEFGEEAARAAWKSAPPKQRRGYRTSDEKRRRDAVILATDDTLRKLGMKAMRAAEWIIDNAGYEGLGDDLQSVRRTLDRLQRKARKVTLEPATPTAGGAARDLGLE